MKPVTLLTTMVLLGAAKCSPGDRAISVSDPQQPATPTVSAARVTNVIVSLGAQTINAGDTLLARATALNYRGDTLTGRTVSWTSSGPSIATVSSTGKVTGLSAGVVTLIALVDSASGVATLNVTDSVKTVTPADSALPELPRVFLDYPYSPATGKSTVVRAGDDLQRALNQAARGDELVLEAGAVFSGNFVLPAKPGTANDGWIVVRSSRLADLPPVGTRIVPARDGPLMPKILTRNNLGALATAARASGWRLVGLEVTVDTAFASQQDGILLIGDGAGNQRDFASVPQDIVLDRMYVHGRTTTNTKRCVGLNAGRTAILDSYLGDCHGKDFDSQAIAGWNGGGPYKIVNNSLQGAGENVIFGGSDPTVPDLLASDLEIRNNYIYTPAAWKGVWLKKNLLELKSAVRVLIEGNVFAGSWAHGQVGFAFVMFSVNQDGRCSWCRVTDVTVRRNYIKDVGAGFNLAGWGGAVQATTKLSRVLIEQNVMEGVNEGIYKGEARMVQVLTGVRDLTVRSNTMTSAAGHNTFLTLSTNAVTNLTYESNIVTQGEYGMIADGTAPGRDALKHASGTITWRDVVVVAPTRGINYPPSTTVVSSLAAANAINGVGANRASVTALVASVYDK